jgi:hypothetical protein
VIGSDGFIDATSNVGAAAVVCPGSEDAARTHPAKTAGKKQLDI